jgi:hypothetical protein
MRTLLLILTLAFATAHADVLVYKGIGTCLQPNDTNQYSKRPRFYFIVDRANNTSYPIFYFTLNGQKKKLGTFPLSPTRYNSGPLTGKTNGSFTFMFDDGGSNNDFGVATFYFRGTEKSLEIRDNTFANYPKTLTGVFRAATNTGVIAYNDEINFVLTFDAIHTQIANNTFRSGATTANDISAELTVKGY